MSKSVSYGTYFSFNLGGSSHEPCQFLYRQRDVVAWSFLPPRTNTAGGPKKRSHARRPPGT